MEADLNQIDPLRRVARELIERGRILIGKWPVVAVAEWYERLEELGTLADRRQETAIFDAALELTVYLSSLVEGGLEANAVQRERTVSLLQALADVVGEGQAGPAPTKQARAASGNHPVVYYLRADDRELPGLSAQLGHERFVVRSFNDGNRALADGKNMPPTAIIVDQGMVAWLSRVIDQTERLADDRRRPVAIVLCDGGDVRNRLFAQRSGAEAVLEGADAIRTVARLQELLIAQRQNVARVLIIDDDQHMGQFCESVLSFKGMISKRTTSAREGLDAISEFKPDLVLLDLYLPDMNGIEVAQLIRERPNMGLVPIVFMSGEEDLDKRFDAIRMGGDDFLGKPVKPRHLLASVMSRVNRSRLLLAQAQHAGWSQHVEGHAGKVDRATLVHDIERARRGELGECVGLVMLSVDDVPALSRRLGFVRTGDLAHQIGTALAGEAWLKSGICALGEFSFLALMQVSSEGALRVASENMRVRLSGRGWLSAEAPVRISFSLGSVRADSGGLTVETLLAKVAECTKDAQDQGGGRSMHAFVASETGTSESTEQKLARAILRRPLLPDTTHFQFQQIVPLKGQLSGQFRTRMFLRAPKTSVTGLIPQTIYQPIIDELHVGRNVNRFQLHVLAQMARRIIGDLGEARLFVDISRETLFEESFAEWLAADLHGVHVDADVLALVLDIGELIDDLPRASRALESAQMSGVRLCLRGFEQFGRDQQRLCRLPSVYANFVQWPMAGTPAEKEAANEARRRLVAESVKNGKIIIATDVDDPMALGELFREGVHYVLGPAVSDWQDRPMVSAQTQKV
ncbi:MAG: response regulator [Ahniella sp.]|nr:response regulator [Ahniella sp.]